MRRLWHASPPTQGRLPPGEYHLARVLDPEPGRLPDPEWLMLLVPGSVSVKIGEGETRGQDLRVR